MGPNCVKNKTKSNFSYSLNLTIVVFDHRIQLIPSPYASFPSQYHWAPSIYLLPPPLSIKQDLNYYNLKNFILKKTSMNLINIFEHKVYSFWIHLWFTSICPLHFIAQFTAAWPSNKSPKLLVSFFVFCPPKISVSTAINLEWSNLSVVMETDSLGGREIENKTDNLGRKYPIYGGVT